MKGFFVLAFFFLSLSLIAQEGLSTLTLSGDLGGKLDGSSWSSETLKGKVHVLFYVDPDHKDLNEDVAELLRAQNFSHDLFQSVAVINMAATWLPNSIIASSLKKKQEKFPFTTYVKDLQKNLVKTWGLKDDSYVILLFSKEGKILAKYEDKLTETQKTELISLIKKNL